MKLLVLALLVLCAGATRYDGYKTYQIIPKDNSHLETLKNLHDEFAVELDFWKESAVLGRSVDVMVPPRLQSFIERQLTERSIEFSVGLDDVQAAIDNSPSISATFDYNAYNTYDNIIQWVSDFAAANSDIVTEVNFGDTLQGRYLRGFRIGVNQGSSKPAVYYQGGIHAREWISPATVINIVRQLVDDYRNKNATVVDMLATFDYYILPVFNADGYEFTYATGGDRMWRKNRNPNGIGCVGVDLNRNYPYQWSANGASDAKCSETYRGTGPASEVETQAITNFLLNEGREWVGFIDFHAYSQLVLSPWSYSGTAILPRDSKELVDAANDAVDALTTVYGTRYTVGPSARTLYMPSGEYLAQRYVLPHHPDVVSYWGRVDAPCMMDQDEMNRGSMLESTAHAASGCSEDWGYATLGAKYSYVVELRPENNPPGFLLPEDQIEPTGIETYELVKSFGATYSAAV